MTCLNLCINYPKKVQFVYKYEIPRTAQIGSGVTFNHKGLGVVIHPNSQIEDNVYIEHHVCLGQRTGTNTAAPVVRKNTVIGAYSVILGGGGDWRRMRVRRMQSCGA
jgi:serine O-acetyltransferase